MSSTCLYSTHLYRMRFAFPLRLDINITPYIYALISAVVYLLWLILHSTFEGTLYTAWFSNVLFRSEVTKVGNNVRVWLTTEQNTLLWIEYALVVFATPTRHAVGSRLPWSLEYRSDTTEAATFHLPVYDRLL